MDSHEGDHHSIRQCAVSIALSVAELIEELLARKKQQQPANTNSPPAEKPNPKPKEMRCTCTKPGQRQIEPCSIHSVVIRRNQDGTVAKVYTARHIGNKSDWDSRLTLPSDQSRQVYPRSYSPPPLRGQDVSQPSSSESIYYCARQQQMFRTIPEKPPSSQGRTPELSYGKLNPNAGSSQMECSECSGKRQNAHLLQQYQPPRPKPPNRYQSMRPSSPPTTRKPYARQNPSTSNAYIESYPKKRMTAYETTSSSSMRSFRLEIFNDGRATTENRLIEQARAYGWREPPSPNNGDYAERQRLVDVGVNAFRGENYPASQSRNISCFNDLQKQYEKRKPTQKPSACQASDNLNEVNATIKGLNQVVQSLQKLCDTADKDDLLNEPKALNRVLVAKMLNHQQGITELKEAIQSILIEMSDILGNNNPESFRHIKSLLNDLSTDDGEAIYECCPCTKGAAIKSGSNGLTSISKEIKSDLTKGKSEGNETKSSPKSEDILTAEDTKPKETSEHIPDVVSDTATKE